MGTFPIGFVESHSWRTLNLRLQLPSEGRSRRQQAFLLLKDFS